MINVDEWAEIRRLHFAEGMGIKAIARRLDVARNTVRSAVRSTDPPRYERPRRPSAVDELEPEICKLLKEFPEMPATVIAERIGWERGLTVAQFDLWQPDVEIPLGWGQADKLWVVTAVRASPASTPGGWSPPEPLTTCWQACCAASSRSAPCLGSQCGMARAASASGARASTSSPRISNVCAGRWGSA